MYKKIWEHLQYAAEYVQQNIEHTWEIKKKSIQNRWDITIVPSFLNNISLDWETEYGFTYHVKSYGTSNLGEINVLYNVTNNTYTIQSSLIWDTTISIDENDVDEIDMWKIQDPADTYIRLANFQNYCLFKVWEFVKKGAIKWQKDDKVFSMRKTEWSILIKKRLKDVGSQSRIKLISSRWLKKIWIKNTDQVSALEKYLNETIRNIYYRNAKIYELKEEIENNQEK